ARLGSDHWQEIEALAESALRSGRRELAVEVFAPPTAWLAPAAAAGALPRIDGRRSGTLTLQREMTLRPAQVRSQRRPLPLACGMGAPGGICVDRGQATQLAVCAALLASEEAAVRGPYSFSELARGLLVGDAPVASAGPGGPCTKR